MKRHNRFENIGGNHYGTLSLLRVRIQRRSLLSGRLLLRPVQEEAVRVRGGLQMQDRLRRRLQGVPGL